MRAHLGGNEGLDLVDGLAHVIVGQEPAIFQAPILRGHGQAMVDALQEIPVVLLHDKPAPFEDRAARCRRARSGRRRETPSAA